MKLKRLTALLLSAVMALSLLCGAAWGEEPGDWSAPELVSAQEEVPEAPAAEEDSPEAAPEVLAVEEDEPEESPEAPAVDEDDPADDGADDDQDPDEEEDQEDENPDESLTSEPPEADDEEDQEGVLSTVNPAFEELVSQEELERDRAEVQEEELSEQAAAKVYTSTKDAGKYLRKQMQQRKKTISLSFKSKDGNKKTVIEGLWAEAMKHTGKPTEGDYIYGQWDRYVCSYKRRYAKGKYTYQLKYKIHFFTSADKEKKTDEAVKKILTQLDLKNDSKFIKLHKIYNYLCDNVVYDHAGANDSRNYICHSAYAAAVKKKAVCQGYAVLLYRLLLEAGVPCRYITGYAGEGHAWNIVKLGGKYYNVDSTWDASLRQEGKYFDYFLRTDATFPDHIRNAAYRTKAFYKSYPMAATDGCTHVWESDYKVDTEATCGRSGVKSIHCMDCGTKKDEEIIPATGLHSWYYYGTYGSREYYVCAVCGMWTYLELDTSLYASNGVIQAQNITRSWSAKEQRFSLGAKSTLGKLSYSSDEEAVQVNAKGRVTVRAGYAGRATITIRASDGKGKNEATRRVTVTVRPRKTRLRRLRADGHGRLKVKWKKDAAASGYEVQYAADRHFRRGVKRVKVQQGSSVTLTGLKKGRRVYVRVRSLAGAAKSCWSEKKSAKVR